MGVPREPFTAKRAGRESAGGAIFKMQLSGGLWKGPAGGWPPKGSITSGCLHLSFLALESTPWLLLLFLCLVVPGTTCFLWPAPGAAPDGSLPRAQAHPSFLGREDEML